MAANKSTMAASQIHSSSTARFSKYPELPPELRLQIIEEVIEAYNPWEMPGRLAKFATIDSEWNRIVERILFRTIDITHKDLIEFGNICGKRQELLKQITLTISDLRHPESTLAIMEKVVASRLSQVFHVMKHWSRADRGPHDLIKLRIHVAPRLLLKSAQDLASSLCCDFTDLPEVSAIGALSANQHGWSKYHLDDSALDSLHEKLPGLHNAKLEIPCQALPQETINDASSEYKYTTTEDICLKYVNNIFKDRINAFHAAKPSLAKLSIFHRRIESGRLVEHRTRITITEALTPQVALWSKNLVCLKLDSVIDIAQFLLTASDSVWPRLRRLDLTGFLDQYDDSPERALDDEEQAFSDVLHGLIAALPSMRNLTRVGVRIQGPTRGHWPLFLGMDLTPRINTERHNWAPSSTRRACPSKDPIIPCGSLTTALSGIIKAYRVNLQGHLVKELQDTLWQQRRLELAAFCCKEGPGMRSLEPGPCCTQWNKETDSWDPAFNNDMDVLIYDMGQYWLQTNPP